MKNKDTARILIVDDQVHALQGVSRIMGNAGYEVLGASNGEDCMKLAARHKPDLILLDVVLPDIDGREVCRRIKSDPETADSYVVLFSSTHIDSDIQAEGLEHGADGYIARPLPNRELLARVKAILRLKFAENRLRENEERYRRISSLTSDIAYSCIKSNNTAYSIDWIMGAVERITGHSEEDIKALGCWSALVIDEDRDIFDTKVVGIAPGSTGSCELRLCHKSGRIVWVSSLSECVLVSENPDGLRLYGGLVDITERKIDEETLRKTTQQLSERVKELNCLYAISTLVEKSDLSLNQTLQEMVDLIPSSWQYPDITCVSLILKGQEFKTENYKAPVSKQSADIIASGEPIGCLEVGYFEQTPESHEGPFLKEERNLIDAIAGRLGKTIEGWLADQDVRKFKAITDLASYGCVMSDLQGFITYANEAFAHMHGFSLSETIGKNLSVFHTDEQMEHVDRLLEKLVRDGAFEFQEVWHAKNDGAVFPTLMNATVIKDDKGTPLFLSATLIDITDRKKAGEAMKLLSTATEQAAEAVIITDANGIIQYVNPAQAILSGYTLNELLGQTPNIFRSDKHPADLYTNMWATINAGNAWQGRFINRKKDGTEYHEDATISPVYDETGKLTNFVAVKHDVTKQVELQEQLLQAQKLEAIGTLAGGFAHDFNNKLQVIDGYVDLMLFEKDLPETAKSKLEVIKQTVHSSAELIKGMMVFVRKTPLELRPIELNKLVAQTRAMLSRSMPKMIEIDLLLEDDLWTINAAPNQIDQILMNLAINARDAMQDGGRLTIKTQNLELDEVFCRSRPGAKPGRYVLIEVSDTGTGMDKETASHIFEPFFTTKASGKGTGLGLAVVYGIVEQHNGWIICDSAPSVGSTFKIYFPAIEEVHEEECFEKKEPPKGKGETILLVDDEPDILEIIERLLNRANYRVITSIHGKDALELYEKHRKEIRLVILDLLMPGMGGKECLRALFRMDPNSRVLMVSGYHEEGITEKLLDAGAKGFIWKPFDEPQLLEKIRAIIDAE